jgi:(S)-ureidoglycine aminohydrolase
MLMHNLGHTRSSNQREYLLQTPDTFVRTELPGMKKASAIVHISPAGGAAFTQYTSEFEPGGVLGPTDAQRFIFVLQGSVLLQQGSASQRLLSNGYAYIPAGTEHDVIANETTRVVVIEKHYRPHASQTAPQFFMGDEDSAPSVALNGDPDLQVRSLLPSDLTFDFAVNTMTYNPGAALSMVEIHVMEHGLLMLEGGGIYRLGDDWNPVTAGDFIWMAPYCPQWFGAIGKRPAKYLIYKDWNRHPLG